MICHIKMGNVTGVIFDNPCSQSYSNCTIEEMGFQNKTPITMETLAML